MDSRRVTEIGAINGFIVREAQKVRRAGSGQPDAIHALVETLQAHY